MGLGPIPAMKKALDKAGMDIKDIDLFELNEAFATQAIACMRELGMSIDKTNVLGSGISLGHPIGCTGARLTVTLLHEMKRRAPEAEKPYYGLATLCVGVGQGEATILEWVGE